MGLIKNLAEVWRIEWDKRRRQKEKYRIEYAFTCAGTKYYRFADITNLPYERGLMALQVYNEVDMRCSRQFLLQYADTIDRLLHEQKIDIFKINQLNQLLKQRLTLATDTDLLKVSNRKNSEGTPYPQYTHIPPKNTKFPTRSA